MWLVTILMGVAVATDQLLPIQAYGMEEDSGPSSRYISLKALDNHVDDPRLPRHLAPSGYRLELQAFPEEGHYMGRVRINMTCREPTDVIILHAHQELNIRPTNKVTLTKLPYHKLHNPTVNERFASPVKVAEVKHDQAKQWLSVRLVEKLKKGRFYQLELLFDGNLTNCEEGFFRGSYLDHESKKTKWYAALQLKPTNARRVFPCFDEPAHKVQLELSVARPISSRAVSNMPIRATEPIEGEWVWDHFLRTPPLATFSVGLLISDLHSLAPFNVSTINGNVTVRVLARGHFLGHVRGVEALTRKAMDVLQKDFGVSYPLPTLTLVALPQFSSQSPSNSWGLVLFQEGVMTGRSARWFVMNQLVEQWLGHLVTPHWWSDARLNQAIANYIATDHVMKVDREVWPVSVGYSIYSDLSQQVGSDKQSDRVRTTKTQWLLRMITQSLSMKTVQAAMQVFVQERAYDTYFEDDVWGSLTKQAWEDKTLEEPIRVEDIARSWLYQDGFPVVTVSWDRNQGTVNLSQHAYQLGGDSDSPPNQKPLWWIPVTFVTLNSQLFKESPPIKWMNAETDVSVTVSSGDELLANIEDTGIFLVNYSPEHWLRLAALMNIDHSLNPNRQSEERFFYLSYKDVSVISHKLPREVCMKLLHDSWALAFGGELDFSVALNMTRAMQRDTSDRLWEVILDKADQLVEIIDGSLAAGKFQSYLLHLVSNLFEHLPIDKVLTPKSAPLERQRERTWDRLCQLGYGPCLSEAQMAFEEWANETNREDGTAIISDQHLCTIFQWGRSEEWKVAVKTAMEPPIATDLLDRRYLLSKLTACLRDKDTIKSILTDAVFVLRSDFPDSELKIVVARLACSSVGRSALLAFLSENWHALTVRFEGNSDMWSFYIEKTMGDCNSQKTCDAVRALYEERKGQLGEAENIVPALLREAEPAVKWSNWALPQINKWLDQQMVQTFIQY